MEFYQDCMEGAVKSLRCSAAKHPVRNEQYVVEHYGAIGSHFGAMDVSLQRTVSFFAGHSCSMSRLL
ncbi:hypothetical protein TNCV_4925251 [Trichonephila clavipes]|nr:hypothetical protein TNCV_4925251 [Trichonephila clavipes]